MCVNVIVLKRVLGRYQNVLITKLMEIRLYGDVKLRLLIQRRSVFKESHTLRQTNTDQCTYCSFNRNVCIILRQFEKYLFRNTENIHCTENQDAIVESFLWQGYMF